MKKTLILAAVFAIAIIASCSKESLTSNEPAAAVQISKPGIPVSFTVGAPDMGENEEDTKVTGEFKSNKYNFSWEKGDKISIFVYDTTHFPASGTSFDARIIDCGEFVAENSGTTATFAGTLPDTLKKLQWTTAFAIYNAGPERTIGAIRNDPDKKMIGYYVRNVYLPVEQDGSGFKYAQFASRYWKLTYDKDSIPSFSTVNPMNLADGVVRFNFNIGADTTIYKLKVRSGFSNATTEQFLTGYTAFLTCQQTVNSAGSAKYLTVYNNGQSLGKEIFAAMRFTNGSATYGDVIFTVNIYYRDINGAERMDVKTINLGHLSATSYRNVSSGYVTPLPVISSLGNDEPATAIKWERAGDGSQSMQIQTIFAPDTAKYKGFPYANNSKIASVTRLYDGKGGANITPKSGSKYIFAPVREYDFKYEGEATRLEIGAITGSTATAYYHFPANVTYPKLNNTYIKIPAKEGYRLSCVKATVTNGNSSNAIKICSDATGGTVIDSSFQPANSTTEYNVTLTSTVANTPYYFCVISERTFKSFDFIYEKVD